MPTPPTPHTTPAPASTQSPDPAATVLRQFRMIFNAVRTHFQQVEKRVGIGGAQVWALNVVNQKPGIGVNDLARAMDIHQSTASNLVRQLLKGQLLRSEKSSTDRRGVQLFIEPEGQRLLARVPGPYEGVLPSALQHLPPQTLERLQTDLNALLEILQTDESSGGIPLAEL